MDIEEVKNLMEKQASNHGQILKILEGHNTRIKNLEEFVWKGLKGKKNIPKG